MTRMDKRHNWYETFDILKLRKNTCLLYHPPNTYLFNINALK